MNSQLFLVCLLMTALSCPTALAQQSPAASRTLPTSGDVEFVHDPAIIREDATWYLFSTGNGPDRKGEIPIRCSEDLHQWRRCGQVFDQIPEGIKKESPATKELWAPVVVEQGDA